MKVENISRRDFLKLLGYGAVSATVVGSGLALADKYVNKDRLIRDISREKYPMPAWLNPDGKKVPKFLNFRNGPESYFRWVSHNSPVLRKTMKKVLERRFYSPPDETPLLGDEFQFHVLHASKALQKETGTSNPSQTLRAATLTFAASSLLSETDVQSFIKVDYPESPDNVNPLTRQMIIRNYPRVFPVSTNSNPSAIDNLQRFMGIDRYVHMSYHMAIVSELRHMHKEGVSDEDLMPSPIAQAASKYHPFGVRELDFSDFVGKSWEIREGVFNPPPAVSLLNFNQGVPTGPFDRFMTLDYCANRLGALAGLAVADRGGYEGMSELIQDVLNNETVTEPVPDVIYPEVDLSFARDLIYQ